MINLVIITERICSCSISGNTVSTVQQIFSVVGKISTMYGLGFSGPMISLATIQLCPSE